MSTSTSSALNELPGLSSAKKLVLKLAVGAPVQAVMFYGMRGSGMEDLAEILTKGWLCQKPTGDGACGGCQACVAFERGRSADLLRVAPAGKSDIIRLDAMIATDPDPNDYPVKVQLFLRTPPLSARTRVVVFEKADRMNPRAANSLLKLLEEPPPYARFILLTESIGRLKPTIISRCTAIACESPERLDDVEPWIAELALNAPRRAEQIQAAADVYRPIYEFAKGLETRRKAEALIASEEFAAMAAALHEHLGGGARAAQAEALQSLAIAIEDAGAVAAVIEAHRRVQGNANFGSVLDALFTKILR